MDKICNALVSDFFIDWLIQLSEMVPAKKA